MRWRREQAGKQIIIVPALLICIFLLGGCNGGTNEPRRINKARYGRKEAKLLKRIDRKFGDVDAHYKLGRLYQAKEQWIQAESQYSIALNFDPVHRPSQAASVKVLMSSGDTTKAKLLAEKYIKEASISAAGSLQLAQAFQEQGLDDYALECYQRAIYLAPTSAKVNRQIGFYYLSKGNKDMAREYLSCSFQLNPNQPDVAGELGRLGVVVRIPKKTGK